MSDQNQNDPHVPENGAARNRMESPQHATPIKGDQRVTLTSLTYNVYPETDKFLDLNASLAEKKAQVINQTGFVEKKGKNNRFGYEYAREADYLNHIRDVMASKGLAFSYTVVEEKMNQFSKTSSGNTRYANRQILEFTLTDTETGFAEHSTLVTYGIDSGDKGVWKGITGAVKYYLAKTFLVPTGDDPENDGGTKYLGERGKEKMYAYGEKFGIGRETLDSLVERVLRLDPDQISVPQANQVKDMIETYGQAMQQSSDDQDSASEGDGQEEETAEPASAEDAVDELLED